MKFLIWFLAATVPVYLNMIGITLGGIPTAILYGILIWLATLLCQKWDLHCINKAASKLGMSSFEYVKTQIPATLLKHIESEKGNPSELKHYLTICVKDRSISKVFADILIDGYTK